eukprot:3934163-Rhodomonas_salina.2
MTISWLRTTHCTRHPLTSVTPGPPRSTEDSEIDLVETNCADIDLSRRLIAKWELNCGQNGAEATRVDQLVQNESGWVGANLDAKVVAPLLNQPDAVPRPSLPNEVPLDDVFAA